MRIMGIDYGDQRIGLALSDESAILCGRAWTLNEWNLDRAVARIAREHERVCLRGFKRIHIERARGLLHRGEHGGDCAVLDVLFLAMQQICAGKAVFFDQIEKCVAIHIRIIAQIRAGWARKTRLQRGKRMRLQGSPKR